MNETKTLNATVVLKEGRPYYELTADHIVCEVTCYHGGRSFSPVLILRPATSEEMVALLKRRGLAVKPVPGQRGATETDRGSLEAINEFIDAHLVEVRLGGQILTQEQVDRVAAQHAIKHTAWEIAYDCNIAAPDSDDGDSVSIDDLLRDDVTISMFVEQSDVSIKEHRVDIDHVLRAPSAKDSLRYAKSSRAVTLRDGTVSVSVNYEARTKLYGELIQFVDGLMINGMACTADNKSAWIDRVPLIQKMGALQHAFRTSERKNG
jgi:hypothetical protein